MTLCQTQRSEKAARNIKPVSKRARTTAPPGPHSGAGRVRRPGGMPRTTTGPPLLVGVKKAAKHNRRGKTKTTERNDQKHPCRLASRKRASEEYQENPKNAWGPEWHPEKTPRSGTHGQKGRTNKCGGTKKEQEKATQGACGGVPCYYLSFLSQKEKRNKNKKDDDVGEKTRGGEKKNPKHQT